MKWLRLRKELNPIQWGMVVIFLLFCWFIIFGNQGFYTYYSLHNTRRELLAEAESLRLQLIELKREEKRLHDPRYLEIIIRQELGYIRPGEVVYQMEK